MPRLLRCRPPTRRHSGSCRASPVRRNDELILLHHCNRFSHEPKEKDEIELCKVRRALGARSSVGFLPNDRMEMCELRVESA